MAKNNKLPSDALKELELMIWNELDGLETAEEACLHLNAAIEAPDEDCAWSFTKFTDDGNLICLHYQLNGQSHTHTITIQSAQDIALNG